VGVLLGLSCHNPFQGVVVFCGLRHGSIDFRVAV
jgi:hypothetical protein